MKKPVYAFLASLVCLVLLAFLVKAQTNTSLVFGSILLQTSDDMIELKAVVIELLGSDGEQAASTLTSDSGKFLFKSIPHGSYTIRVKNNNGRYYIFEDGHGDKTGKEVSIANKRTNLSETVVYQAN